MSPHQKDCSDIPLEDAVRMCLEGTADVLWDMGFDNLRIFDVDNQKVRYYRLRRIEGRWCYSSYFEHDLKFYLDTRIG